MAWPPPSRAGAWPRIDVQLSGRRCCARRPFAAPRAVHARGALLFATSKRESVPAPSARAIRAIAEAPRRCKRTSCRHGPTTGLGHGLVTLRRGWGDVARPHRRRWNLQEAAIRGRCAIGRDGRLNPSMGKAWPGRLAINRRPQAHHKTRSAHADKMDPWAPQWLPTCAAPRLPRGAFFRSNF